MASSGMLRRVDLVRTDVSDELSTSNIRVTKLGELGTTLAVTRNRSTLRRNAKSCIFFLLFVLLRSLHWLLVTANDVHSSSIE
jgi:hypothetical protein